MIHTYDKVYLDNARVNLGRMLDFAVYDLKYNITDFFDKFISSGIASRFGMGDFQIVAGKSGVEIAYEVAQSCGEDKRNIKPQYTANRSAEYWAGWALAYYQWKTGLSFEQIIKYIAITDILNLYNPYHEMDIRQFADKMNELSRKAHPDTNLKVKRQNSNLSQNDLAEISGVPLRTVQQYEQRQKNINNAKAETLVLLSKALKCKVEDIIEYVQ